MSRALQIALLALVLSGCGRAPVVSPEVQPYYDAFMSDARAHGLKTSGFYAGIEFGDVQAIKHGQASESKGVCVYQDNRIVLDRVYWDSLIDAGKMLLVYHELGHCILVRAHNDTLSAPADVCTGRDADGNCTATVIAFEAPVSIMHSSLILPQAVAANPDYKKVLVDELFKGVKI